MTPRLCFTNLPIEIGLLILHQLDSVRTLHCFISASSYHYRLFRENRLNILAFVVPRSFHPSLLPLAVLVCEASDISLQFDIRQGEYDYKCPRTLPAKTAFSARKRKAVAKFLTKQWSEESLLASLHSKAIVLPLCRLYYVMDYFIMDYFEQTLALVQKHDRWGIFNSNQSISDCEYARLQRAFLHFELYRRLLGGLRKESWQGSEQARVKREHLYFLAYLELHEMRELLAIYEYLQRRIEDLMDRTEDLLVEFVQNAPPGSPFPICTLDLQLPLYGTYSKDAQQAVVAFLNELGLPFQRLLFNAKDTKEFMQIAMLFENVPREPTLSTVIKENEFRERHLNSDSIVSIIHAKHGPGSELQISQCIDDDTQTPSAELHQLRLSGCYFWDRGRIADIDRFQADLVKSLPKERKRAMEIAAQARLAGSNIKLETLRDFIPLKLDSHEASKMIRELEY